MDFEVVRDGIKAIIVVVGIPFIVWFFLWASFGRD